MKAKKEHESRLPILRQRLIELQGEKTHEEFARVVGITRQTMGFYLRGERIPDSETLIQICERCDVSSDWLLGLSDVRSTETHLREICTYTGLSEQAVSVLHAESSNPTKPLEEINRLFENFAEVHGLICEISTAMKAQRKTKSQGSITRPLPHDLAFAVSQWEEESGGVVLDHKQAADWHAEYAGKKLRDLIVCEADSSVSPSFADALSLCDEDLPDDPDAPEIDPGEEE